MKRKLLVGVLLMTFLVGCAYFQTAKARTETITISYETVGMIAFPTVLAYLQQRELNGSLTGQALANAKVAYANAKAKYVQAGDMIIQYIQGPQPGGNVMSQVAIMLRQVAILLADLSGGKVVGNQLTIPVIGGK